MAEEAEFPRGAIAAPTAVPVPAIASLAAVASLIAPDRHDFHVTRAAESRHLHVVAAM
jgi:hypothetical protein